MMDHQSVPKADGAVLTVRRLLCTLDVRKPYGTGSDHGKLRPYSQPNEKHEGLDSPNITSLNT